MEKWKKVKNTKGMIEVSNEGRVRSLLSGKPYILKTQPDKKGYHRLRVTIDKNKMSFKLHRIVAEAFIENPYNLPQVNHKDGNKNNNSVNNLEWITNKDNANHAIKNNLWQTFFEGAEKENKKRQKPVIAYKDNQEIKFNSVAEAERFLNSKHVSDVLKGRRKHVKGYSFTYESEVMP